MKRWAPGQPLKFSAEQLNRYEQSADWWSRNVAGGQTGPQSYEPRPTDVVTIYNDTGANLRVGDAIGAAGTIPVASLRLDTPWLLGGYATSGAGFGIYLEPTADNRYGRAQFSGCCCAYVDVQSTSHKRADADGSATLVSNDSGPVEILYKPAGVTGEQLCFVRLGSPLPILPVYNAPGFDGSSAFSTSPQQMSMTPLINDDGLWTLNGGENEITFTVDGLYRVSLAARCYKTAGTPSTDRYYAYTIRDNASGGDGVCPVTPYSEPDGGTVMASSLCYFRVDDTLKWYIAVEGTASDWVTNAVDSTLGDSYGITVELLRRA